MLFTLYIGGPGTGKTTTLKRLQQKRPGQVLCFTRLSCDQVKGSTLYQICQCSYKDFKPKKFKQTVIYIDEIFMFSKDDFANILQCANDDTEFHMFGDPYQLKSPTEQGYFYELIDNITLIKLETYYRSENDQTLQNLLKSFRLQKRISPDDLPEECFNLPEKWTGYTVIVGTHKKEEYYRKKIQKQQSFLFSGPDGQLYRQNQVLYTQSPYGSIQCRVVLKYFDQNKNMIVETKEKKEIAIAPTINGRLYYQISNGDALTVNKCQGLEFEKIIIDIDSLFEFGSFYTAISRVKSINDIKIIGNRKKVFETDEDNRFV